MNPGQDEPSRTFDAAAASATDDAASVDEATVPRRPADARPRPDAGDGRGGADGTAARFMPYRWEVPCAGTAYVDGAGAACTWDPALLKRSQSVPGFYLYLEETRSFGGKPDLLYEVTLRFRGVVEPKSYSGGTRIGQSLQLGGTSIATNFNTYSLGVSEPAQTLYLNRSDKAEVHATFVVDETVTIKVKGGAKLTFGVYDRNDLQIANFARHLVPDIAPYPQPYNGQFIQMDVVTTAPEVISW